MTLWNHSKFVDTTCYLSVFYFFPHHLFGSFYLFSLSDLGTYYIYSQSAERDSLFAFGTFYQGVIWPYSKGINILQVLKYRYYRKILLKKADQHLKLRTFLRSRVKSLNVTEFENVINRLKLSDREYNGCPQ